MAADYSPSNPPWRWLFLTTEVKDIVALLFDRYRDHPKIQPTAGYDPCDKLYCPEF